MKKRILFLVAALALLLSACGGSPSSAMAEELSAKYDFYEKSAETAKVFNQLHPQIIESSMLTIYETSELYQEIQKGNWKEESELEKLAELKALIENLTIQTRIVTDGASNLIQVRGNLPADKEKLVKYLERLIATADESALREYRVNLKHL